MKDERARRTTWWLALLGVAFVVFTWQFEASVWLVICGVTLLIVRMQLSVPHDEKRLKWKFIDALHKPLAVFCASLAILLAIVFVLNQGLIDEQDTGAVFAIQARLLAVRDSLDSLHGLGSFWQKTLLFALLVTGAFLSRSLSGKEGLFKSLTTGLKRGQSYVSTAIWFLIAFCAFTVFSYPYGDNVAQMRLDQTREKIRVVSSANEQARLTAAVNREISDAIGDLGDEGNLDALVSKLDEARIIYVSYGDSSVTAGEAVADSYVKAYWPGPGSDPWNPPDDPPGGSDSTGGAGGTEIGQGTKSQGSTKDGGSGYPVGSVFEPSRYTQPEAGPKARKVVEASLETARAETVQLAAEIKESESVLQTALAEMFDDVASPPDGFQPFLEKFVSRVKGVLVNRLIEEGAKSKAIKTARFCFVRPVEQWIQRKSLFASLNQSVDNEDWSTAQSNVDALEALDHDYTTGNSRVQSLKSLVAFNLKVIEIEAHIEAYEWESAIDAFDTLPDEYIDTDAEQRIRVMLAQAIVQVGESTTLYSLLEKRLATPAEIWGAPATFRADDRLANEITVQANDLLDSSMICQRCHMPLWTPGCMPG